MTSLDEIYFEIMDNIGTPGADFILLKMLKEKARPQWVIKACLRALEFFPDDINLRRLLAQTYFEQGLIQLAERELQKLHRKIDELSSICKLEAELFKKEGRINDAVNSLKLYLAHHRGDQEAAELLSELSSPAKEEPTPLPTPTLAEIYCKQGETEEAIKIYEQVVEASPDDEKSKIRLNELKEMKEAQERGKAREGILKEKKLRLIGILERWLVNIEQRRAMDLAH